LPEEEQSSFEFFEKSADRRIGKNDLLVDYHAKKEETLTGLAFQIISGLRNKNTPVFGRWVLSAQQPGYGIDVRENDRG